VILLDTSVLSRVFRRRRPGPREQRLQRVVEDLMAGESPLGLPGIVLQEVLSGIRSQKQFEELERRLLAAFTILLPTTANHIEAARLRNKCLANGVSASGPDCLIAVIATSANHELFATDGDFEAIAKHAPLKLFVDEGGV
jgi:predicted nucleic acid-binding protein